MLLVKQTTVRMHAHAKSRSRGRGRALPSLFMVLLLHQAAFMRQSVASLHTAKMRTGAAAEVDPACSLPGFADIPACRWVAGAAVSAAVSDSNPAIPSGGERSTGQKHEIAFALTAQQPGCSAAGRRSIAASVNRNVIALPGVVRSATRVICNKSKGSKGKGARYNVLTSYVGTGEAKTWLDTSLLRISPCCLWRLPPLCSAFHGETGGADSISDASFCTLASGSLCSLAPPPPPPQPPPPPPPALTSCEDYLPFTATNLVVWGDQPGAEWTTNPSGTGTCSRDPLSVTFSPTSGPCAPLTTSLVVVERGMVFANCSVYDKLALDGLSPPVVGPDVAMVVERVTSLTIQAILLANVAQVTDCAEVLRFSVITSAGTISSVELPCTPSELDPYRLPGAGAQVPAGERAVLRFSGMTSRHVFSLRRLYYRDSFAAR